VLDISAPTGTIAIDPPQFTPRENGVAGPVTLTISASSALARMVYGIVCFATLFSFVGQFELGWKSLLAAWFLPGLAADLLFGLTAWRRLQTDFREVAAHRFVPSKSRLGAWIKGDPRPATPPSAVNPEAA